MSFIEKAKRYFKEKLDTANLSDTTWENRPYDFYLIFGQNEENKFPWIRSTWVKDIEPHVDLLLKQTESYHHTGLRATVYAAEKRIAKKDNREFTYHSEIKLGRLRWDLKSHEKWTLLNNADNYFQYMELWTPIWTVCEKRNAPPDIYISITNENDFENKREVQFGYFIVIAVAKNLKIDSKPVIKTLSEKMDAELTIVKTRNWGKPEKAGNWTFANWIEDTFSNGIYNEKNLHSINLNELKFEPHWELVYKQK